MKYVGLDFETANPDPGSICAAGIAVVENGEYLEGKEWRIRPHSSLDYMHPVCQAVHGISHEEILDKPAFRAVWPEMREWLGRGDLVVIHNAAFDLRHLRAVLALYQLDSISFPYVCSLCASRRQLPDLPCHKLDYLAEYYDLKFVHHNALEDAMTCAKILSFMGFPEKNKKIFAFEAKR